MVVRLLLNKFKLELKSFLFIILLTGVNQYKKSYLRTAGV